MVEVLSGLDFCSHLDTPAVTRHLHASSYLHTSGLGGDAGFSIDNFSVCGSAKWRYDRP